MSKKAESTRSKKPHSIQSTFFAVIAGLASGSYLKGIEYFDGLIGQNPLTLLILAVSSGLLFNYFPMNYWKKSVIKKGKENGLDSAPHLSPSLPFTLIRVTFGIIAVLSMHSYTADAKLFDEAFGHTSLTFGIALITAITSLFVFPVLDIYMRHQNLKASILGGLK
ncbi:hypothetical protein [Neptunomonas concharum]|uniref:Uncharacterized protein n=1 Tax=Neptunomonas concharum TaxID=1031538 RepID=A0A5P1R6I5_9GAMM|nr:hypothetical protein [Neptunomonas concharum]QEQ95287.1 hypothetical protein F0U83_00425 [Neptunomonas concharum]